MKEYYKKKKSNVSKIVLILTLSIPIALCVFYNKPPDYIISELRSVKSYGVEDALVFAVIKCESGFDENAMSLKGACGLMQLNESTFRYICSLKGLRSDDIFDPSQNIAAGRAYLSYLSERFYGLDEILCAYNAGEGRTRAWLSDKRYSSDGRKIKSIPYKETKEYVARVKTYYYFYKGAGI